MIKVFSTKGMSDIPKRRTPVRVGIHVGDLWLTTRWFIVVKIFSIRGERV